VYEWLRRYKGGALTIHKLSRLTKAGNLLPNEVEEWQRRGDLAIVVATPDDVGYLASEPGQRRPRTRQNVWLEFGWFWGRLGIQRTALMVMQQPGKVINPTLAQFEQPSNIAGLDFIPFSPNTLGSMRTPETPAWYLDKFIRESWANAPEDVTEVRAARHNPRSRDEEWNLLHRRATRSLVITGIAMGKLVDDLGSILALMRKRPSLHLTLVPVDAVYLRQHHLVFTKLHRTGTVRDNATFFEELATALQRNRATAPRVTLAPYKGVPPFAATIADGGDRSSRLLVQPFVPKPESHPQAHPRFELVARSQEGVYPLYWGAVQKMIRSSHKITGASAIRSYVQSVQST
jgi:hypothetical protein